MPCTVMALMQMTNRHVMEGGRMCNPAEQTAIPNAAITANIGDGDYRTYCLICHLAQNTQPDAEQPYIDLTYSGIGRSPSRQPSQRQRRAGAYRAPHQRRIT